LLILPTRKNLNQILSPGAYPVDVEINFFVKIVFEEIPGSFSKAKQTPDIKKPYILKTEIVTIFKILAVLR
jgi:hypothetical protein